MASRRRDTALPGATTRLRVGDRVRLNIGGHEISAVVVEDRGAIGVDGRQIVRVEAKIDPARVESFEMPADDLRRIRSAA